LCVPPGEVGDSVEEEAEVWETVEATGAPEVGERGEVLVAEVGVVLEVEVVLRALAAEGVLAS